MLKEKENNKIIYWENMKKKMKKKRKENENENKSINGNGKGRKLTYEKDFK